MVEQMDEVKVLRRKVEQLRNGSSLGSREAEAGVAAPTSDGDEQALLGALLAAPELLGTVPQLQPRHFSSKAHRAILAALVALVEEGAQVDLFCVCDRLEEQRQWDAAVALGELFLPEALAHNAGRPTASTVCAYAEKVVAAWQRRVLEGVPAALERALDSSEPVAKIIERCRKGMDWLSADGTAGLHVVSLARVGPRIGQIEWVWAGWMPKGLVTLVVGESGIGKSALVLRLAGSVLSGDPWPDEQPGPVPGTVLWLDTEASQVLLSDRAHNWSLPAEKLLLPWDSAAGASADIRFHEDWELVDRTVCQRGVDLLVVDSLTGFSIGNENLAEDVSEVLLQLSELARRRGIPVLVVHHLRKHSGGDRREVNLDRVRGSTAITQFCRSVLAVERPDPTQDTLRLRQIKNNLGTFATPLGFRITETGLIFCEAPQPSTKSSQLEAATEFLMAALSEESRWASDLIQEAEQAGISQRTLQRAATALGVIRDKYKEGWAWTLPDPDPEEGDDGSPS